LRAQSPFAESPTIPPFRYYHQESGEKGTFSFEIAILYPRLFTPQDEISSKQKRLKQIRSISPHNASTGTGVIRSSSCKKAFVSATVLGSSSSNNAGAGASMIRSSSPNKACVGATNLGSSSSNNASTGASVMGSLTLDNSRAGASVSSFELSNQHLNLNNFKKILNIQEKIILENPIY
jgi:hypothetical protein